MKPNLVELISQTVKLKKVGKEWEGLCPFHADKVPSLKVNAEKGVWVCHSCNIGGSVYDFVMRRDDVDFAEAKHRLEGHMPAERTTVATYDYTDPDGKLLYQVVRYYPKSFSQRQPDGKGGWVHNLKGVEQVLYNLPALASADTVLVVEGEKDANRLISEGLVATTSSGGAGKWKPHYSQALRGKKVLIIPDNDAEGEHHASQVMASLKNIASEVLVCRLPGLADKGDVSDWLDAGNDVKDLEKHYQKPDAEPKLEIKGSIYEFKWGEFVALVSRMKEAEHRQPSAEIKINMGHTLLAQSKLNLLYTRTEIELAKRLQEKCPTQDWGHIIEQICQETLEALRQGEPVVELWTSDDIEAPRYILDPLIVENQSNVIFGDPSASKSTLAVILAQILMLPWHDNPMELQAPEDSIRCLYLDWEADEQTIQWLTTMLQRGAGLHPLAICYRHCDIPFAADFEQIRQHIDAVDAKVIIIDSLGLAAGGKLNDTDPPLTFYAALRKLKNITSIILAHNSKDPETKKRSIYGNQFFTVQARNVWEIRKVQEPGSKLVDIALFHRKPPPFHGLHPPMGFKMLYAEDDKSFAIEPRDPRYVGEFLEQMSTRQRVFELLKSGARTPKEISEELEEKESHIRVAISTMKKKGLVVKVGLAYGLAARGEEV